MDYDEDQIDSFFIRNYPQTKTSPKKRPTKPPAPSHHLPSPARSSPGRRSRPASLAAEDDILDLFGAASSDDEGEVTASQIDRHSLANLLKSAGLPGYEPTRDCSPARASDAGPQCESGETRARGQAKHTDRAPSSSPIEITCVRSASRTSEACSTSTGSKQPSTTSRRTWSMPQRPRERRTEARPVARPAPPPSPPRHYTSTPSRTTTTGRPLLDCSISPIRSPGPESPPPLPSPLNLSPLQPFVLARASPSPRASRSSQPRSCTPTSAPDRKGKGKAREPSPARATQVLAPDSSETPPGSVGHRDSDEERSEHAQCLPESETDLGQDGTFDGPVADERSPSHPPSSPPARPRSKFFNPDPQSPGRASVPKSKTAASDADADARVDSEEEKRRQLLADLGFDDEPAEPAQVLAPPTSSPIEIVAQGRATPHAKGSRTHRQASVESEWEDPEDFVRAEDELRLVGIFVGNSPSSGIAPLMNTWPRDKRHVFMKMAGVTCDGSDGDSDDGGYRAHQSKQVKEWDGLLVKKKKSSTSSAPKKKTWTNRGMWKKKSSGSSSANGSKAKKAKPAWVAKKFGGAKKVAAPRRK